jgi:PhzF family phenazine biosynthesis protein
MKTYFVDSFTHEPFKGNPAGVCFVEQALEDEVMLKIAQEFGFSETAFIQKTNQSSWYTIRYFSPKQEIPLCGHATLASAKVLFKETDLNEINFITSENLELVIKKHNDEIVMEFPVYETIAATVPPATLAALGLEKVVNTFYSPKNKIIGLEISDSKLLAKLAPDFDALVHSYDNINGVLVTARSSEAEFDFHYRYFWPWSGTNEDPVTGGVQTFLAKYWAEKLNKKEMKAFQSSQRTGYMTVKLQGNKVMIFGRAVIILEGNLVY